MIKTVTSDYRNNDYMNKRLYHDYCNKWLSLPWLQL